MTLNASGQLSLGGNTTGESVALELAQSATGQVSMNDASIRCITSTSPGSAITLPTNFYGKQYIFNTLFTYTLNGAGGGGGGNGWCTGGGGGGGAGGATGTLTTKGSNIAVTVGAPGVGGGRNPCGSRGGGQWTGYYAPGSSGGTATFVNVNANGGGGGVGGNRGNGFVPGGAGGTGTGGTTNYSGNAGCGASPYYFCYGSGISGMTGGNAGGPGAGSGGGGGGSGLCGIPGNAFGGGGGGYGQRFGSSPGGQGGMGGSSRVVVSYAGNTQKYNGGSVSIAGGNVTHTFNSSGNLTQI